MGTHVPLTEDPSEHVKLLVQDTAVVATTGNDDKEYPSLTIDPCFVVPLEHRPLSVGSASSLFTDHIPVVDLAPVYAESTIDAPALEALVAQVALACAEWGFFQVINHGVPPGIIQTLKDEATAFFELPTHKKLEVKRTYDNPLGYNDGEFTNNVRDWKEVFDMAPGGSFELPLHFDGDDDCVLAHLNQWPSFMPSLRKACEEYMSSIEKLSLTLLELIARSLGLPPRRLHEDFKSSATSIFRINYYPVCPAPELALGVSRHKDVGALTVLLQDDVGGLEVRRRDGEWIGVNPDPQALVINVGDAFQVYSNDKYQSVEHRVVVNANKDRYSFPLFFNPAHSADLSPVSELIDDAHPPQYRLFNWGKYFKRRMAGNYKNLENFQISHHSLHA